MVEFNVFLTIYMYHANKITNTMNWSTIRQLLMSLCQKESTSLFL